MNFVRLISGAALELELDGWLPELERLHRHLESVEIERGAAGRDHGHLGMNFVRLISGAALKLELDLVRCAGRRTHAKRPLALRRLGLALAAGIVCDKQRV